MGHTGCVSRGRQDLPECASVRIDVLVVGNDLKRPDRVRGHVPPLRGAARGHRIHAAITAKRVTGGPFIPESVTRCRIQPSGVCPYGARRVDHFMVD